MILLKLFLTFARIGIVGFGGGYAMIPLIQAEIHANGWLSRSEFGDIVAVSQMTPGPVAVNAATFIGIRTVGISGALAATVGLIIPSLIIVAIAAHMVEKFKESKILQSMLSCIRPAAIGLIGSAVMLFASMSLYSGTFSEGTFRLEWTGISIFIAVLVLAKKFKIHPIYTIIFSGLAGIGLFMLFG
ncbi:MAG: chromate transporter [Spirochaetales bacterium]|jgi:chromate transporter|nr:chromate transporter [Spirochaetales bacterium]